ncbi:MAG: hypothetical protein WBE18_08265 [Gammaproteobacteria bacterium]
MKKSKLLILAVACSLPTFICSTLYAAKTNCPNEAIHCVYNSSDSGAKWVKAVMLPKNINIVVCMDNDTVLYLEKDDVKMDKLKPGSTLIWELSQCFDEHCTQDQPLGTDQFTLLRKAKHYTTDPAFYSFSIDRNYGETCQFPIKKLMLDFS